MSITACSLSETLKNCRAIKKKKLLGLHEKNLKWGCIHNVYRRGWGGRGQRIFLKGENFSDIPPLDQKKREERSSILDVNQRSFLKICCQLDGNLDVFTFDYRTVLDV